MEKESDHLFRKIVVVAVQSGYANVSSRKRYALSIVTNGQSTMIKKKESKTNSRHNVTLASTVYSTSSMALVLAASYLLNTDSLGLGALV